MSLIPVHFYSSDGVFDEAEEVYQLNDLTTKDDHDLRQYYPKTQTDDGMCRCNSHGDIGSFNIINLYILILGIIINVVGD